MPLKKKKKTKKTKFRKKSSKKVTKKVTKKIKVRKKIRKKTMKPLHTSIWKCNCSEMFTSFSRFKKHNPKNCIKKKRACPFCGKFYKTSKSLKRHLLRNR